MVLTPSTMLALGTPAPDFALPDSLSGKVVRPSDFAGKRPLLVMFLSNHCPYVQHIREGLATLGRDYEDRDVGIVAICANDRTTHPEDAPEKMQAEARRLGYTFPWTSSTNDQGGGCRRSRPRARRISRLFDAECWLVYP